MVKLLHFGISRNRIIQQYEKMLCMPFPDVPESDELYDLFSELVELDGFVMGIASSYIKGNTNGFSIDNCDCEFNKLRQNIKINSNELGSLLHYKTELDKLIKMLKNVSISMR